MTVEEFLILSKNNKTYYDFISNYDNIPIVPILFEMESVKRSYFLIKYLNRYIYLTENTLLSAASNIEDIIDMLRDNWHSLFEIDPNNVIITDYFDSCNMQYVPIEYSLSTIENYEVINLGITYNNAFDMTYKCLKLSLLHNVKYFHITIYDNVTTISYKNNDGYNTETVRCQYSRSEYRMAYDNDNSNPLLMCDKVINTNTQAFILNNTLVTIVDEISISDITTVSAIQHSINIRDTEFIDGF